VLILTLCLLHSMDIFVSPSLSHPKVENLCESHCLFNSQLLERIYKKDQS
jgi:hypothetical protein